MKSSCRTALLCLLPIAIIGFFAARPAHSLPTANIDQPIETPESMDKQDVYLLDPRITSLLAHDLLEITRIIPNHKDAAGSRLSQRIEDVEWIPARGNADGKKGIVRVNWLVDPSGQVLQLLAYTLEGDRELVNIVAEVAKGYRFKPTEGSRKYRLVTAKYVFPPN